MYLKHLYLLLLFISITFITGCPQTITKPTLKIGKDGKIDSKLPLSVINHYLVNAQIRYDCYKQGKQPTEQKSLTTKSNQSPQILICSGSASWIYPSDTEKSLSTGAIWAKQERDDAIESALALIDANYENFIDNLNNGRSAANFVADVIELGTSASIGVTKGERPLHILGIALTAFRGGRKSADLNFFKEQSTPVLINKMDDNRAKWQSIIIQQKKRPIDQYSMKEAIRDTVAYYNAGTLVRAFSELSRDTAAQAKKSEETLLDFKGLKKSLPVTKQAGEISINASEIIEYLRVSLTSKNTEIVKNAEETLQAIYKDLVKIKEMESLVALHDVNETTTDGNKIRTAIIELRREIDDSNNDELSEKVEKVIVENYKKIKGEKDE